MDLVERRGADAARHPWEIARAEFFRLLAQHDLLSTGRAWLDIGSGDAWFAKQLRRHVPASAPITCWDVNYTRDDVARSAEGLELVAERPGSAADRVLRLAWTIADLAGRQRPGADDVRRAIHLRTASALPGLAA